ncbi:MAG: DEAD/DEAH box helicase [Pirellulales bacterium]
MMFENLGLDPQLVRAVREEGYQQPTPIQAQAIPQVLSGRDLLGCAQTGTGKTAAFALPTLQRLLAAPRSSARRPIRTLVLAPTRELAGQIGESFETYGRFTGLRHTVIFGGVGQGRQVTSLQRGVDTLVATPGRLLDLMQQRYVSLANVEILVLDEADQMLDMGFLPDLRRIVAQVPRQRQTLMFSATMPDEIRRLADQWLNRPVSVQVAPVATPAERVEQAVYLVESRDKPRLLAQYLQSQATGRTLVFTRTKHGADKVVRLLERAGIRAAAIHGNKSQNARLRVLAEFKSQQPPVLVATDIAARGLDIDQISHVINYDVPNVPETYVHRIGRTGRAGATGVAMSLCSGEEREYLRQIERLTRRRITVADYDLPPAPAPHHDARPSNGSQRSYSANAAPRPAAQAHPPGHRQRSFGRGSRGSAGRRYSSRV